MSKELTQENFQTEVLESKLPVLVDFWAEWCGPCKMVSPILDQVSADLDGSALVGKVDVDAHRDLAAKYNVRAIPTLLFFKDGEVKDQVVGASFTPAEIKAKLLALV